MAKYKGRYAKRPGLKLSALVCGVCLLMVAALGWGVAAKYIREQKNEQGLVKALEFYFYSDHLDAQGTEYELAANTTSITFDVRNYKDALNVSQLSIAYSITVEQIRGDSYEDVTENMSISC